MSASKFIILSALANASTSPLIDTDRTLGIWGGTSQLSLVLTGQALADNQRTIVLSHGIPPEFSHANLTYIRYRAENLSSALRTHHLKSLIATLPIWLVVEYLPSLNDVERLVVFSSTSRFGKFESKNPAEQEIVRKLIDSEETLWRWAEKQKVALTILRPTLIYGVGMDKNVMSIARVLKRFHFFPIGKSGKGKRQPVHVEDLARAARIVLTEPKTFGNAYNLSGGETLTFYEMVKRIAHTLEYPAAILPVPGLASALDFAGKVSGKKELSGEVVRRMERDLVFDHQDAYEHWGYAPQPFLPHGKRDLGE